MLPLLDALEAHWSRLELPLVAALRPGLAREDIEAVAAEAGLTLPDELVALYGWHDGVENVVSRCVYGAFEFTPLREALDGTIVNRAVQQEQDEYFRAVVPRWPDDYLQVFEAMTGDSAGWCGAASGARTRYFDWESPERGHDVPFDAPDLTTLLGWWLAVFQAGGVAVSDHWALRRTLSDDQLPRAARGKRPLV